MLSAERFESYRNLGTDTETLARNLWNIALCEALYPSLQAVEVAFRNRVHQTISDVCGDPDWIINPAFLKRQEQETIESCKDDLRVRNRPVTTGYLIAELKFGFWTSLADARYDKIWHKIIRPVFPSMPGPIRTRGEVSTRLHSVRHLRNSVFHHHSIWHWANLTQQYADVYALLSWMEPAYATWVKSIDRFPQILAGGHRAYLP